MAMPSHESIKALVETLPCARPAAPGLPPASPPPSTSGCVEGVVLVGPRRSDAACVSGGSPVPCASRRVAAARSGGGGAVSPGGADRLHGHGGRRGGQSGLVQPQPPNNAITKYEARWRVLSDRTESLSAWGTPSGGAAARSVTLTSLLNGVEYFLQVRAVAGMVAGAAAEAFATPLANNAPAKPTGLTATAGNQQVALSWTAPGGTFIGYQVQHGQRVGLRLVWGAWTTLSGTGTSHTVTGLTNGTAYSFRVRAVNGAVLGAASDAVSATPAVLPPAVPTNFTAVAGPGSNEITMSWTRPSGPITDYQYRTRRPGGGWFGWATMTGGADITTFTATFTEVLDFQMRARNGSGDGAESAIVRATPVAAPAAPTGLTAAAGNRQVTELDQSEQQRHHRVAAPPGDGRSRQLGELDELRGSLHRRHSPTLHHRTHQRHRVQLPDPCGGRDGARRGIEHLDRDPESPSGQADGLHGHDGRRQRRG